MVRKGKQLEAFEKRMVKQTKVTVREAFRIFEALRQEAISLGVWKGQGSRSDLESKVRVARFLNREDESY